MLPTRTRKRRDEKTGEKLTREADAFPITFCSEFGAKLGDGARNHTTFEAQKSRHKYNKTEYLRQQNEQRNQINSKRGNLFGFLFIWE